MMKEEKLRVRLEFGEAKADFEGDINEVLELTIKFLTRIYPNLRILQSITYAPDVAELAKKATDLIKVSDEGPILQSDLDAPAKDAICLALLGAYLGKMLGKLERDSMSTREIARIIGKAKKTVSNEMPKLVSDGLVERTSEGEYRLTILGIKKAESLLEQYKK